MRVVLLLIVTACWRRESTPTPVPRPESQESTVYRNDPVRHDTTAPPVGPIFGGGRNPPPPPLVPITTNPRIGNALPCGPMPNATANGIQLSAIDHTGHNIDLCPRMDTALSKAPNIANYQNVGYDVAAQVSTIVVGNGTLTCKLSVAILAPMTKSGFANGAARVQFGATTPRDVANAIGDCATAVIEDLLLRKIFP